MKICCCGVLIQEELSCILVSFSLSYLTGDMASVMAMKGFQLCLYRLKLVYELVYWVAIDWSVPYIGYFREEIFTVCRQVQESERGQGLG